MEEIDKLCVQCKKLIILLKKEAKICSNCFSVLSGGKLNLRSDLKDDGGWSSCNRSKCQFWLEYFFVGIENCGSGFKAQHSVDDDLRRKTRFGKSELTRCCQFWSRFSSQCFVLATGSLAAINCCSQFFCHLGNQRGPFWMANQRNHRQSCSSSLSHGPDYTRALSLLC